MAIGLVAWFMTFFTISTALLDDWIAATFFAWLPDAILQFGALEGAGEGTSGPALATLLVIAFTFNGVVAPVTDELHFRGHLLPRIARYGPWAPVLNTVLFWLSHFWTWMAWRKRSVQVTIAAHVTVNTVFLLGLFALVLG